MITLMKLDLFNMKSGPSTFLNSLASLRYLLENFLKTMFTFTTFYITKKIKHHPNYLTCSLFIPYINLTVFTYSYK